MWLSDIQDAIDYLRYIGVDYCILKIEKNFVYLSNDKRISFSVVQEWKNSK